MAQYIKDNSYNLAGDLDANNIIGYGVLLDNEIYERDGNPEQILNSIQENQLILNLEASLTYKNGTNIAKIIFDDLQGSDKILNESYLLICSSTLAEKLSNYAVFKRFFGQLILTSLALIPSEPEARAENVQNFENPLNLSREELESACINLEELFRKNALTSTISNSLNLQENCLKNFSGLLTHLQEFLKHLTNKLANSQGGVSYHELIEIEKLVKNHTEKLEKIQKSIDHGKSMCETFADQNLERGEKYLKIKKFFFDVSLNVFRIQIENDTDFTFYNVDLLLLDDRNGLFQTSEICKFRIIEKNSKVWKELDIPISDDYYGLHLTLIYRAEHVIKEPFFIAPCKLYLKKIAEVTIDNPESTATGDVDQVDAYCLGFYLKNYSNIRFNKVVLSLPETIKEQNFGGLENFNYGVTWVTNFTVRKSFIKEKAHLAQNYRVFACDGNRIISNTVTISDLDYEIDENSIN
jgi:hypothetical protein